MRSVALVVLLALGLACTSSTRYRLPLRGNPQATVADACYARCSARGHGDAFYACLETCPGIQLSPGNACGLTDAPPRARCAARDTFDASGGLAALGIGLLALLDIVVLGLWSGD